MNSKLRTFLISAAILVALATLAGGVFWWRLAASPQYSLALLIDRVQGGDDSAVDEFVDVDSVIDSVLPQIQQKAVELYGKGLPPSVLDKVAEAAEPLKPALRRKAKVEMPRYIREKTAEYRNYPASFLAFGLWKTLTVDVAGDEAAVTVPLSQRKILVTMRRNGSRWKIIGVRDEVLAKQAAEKIGEELVVAAIKGGVSEVAEKLGIGGVQDILDKIDGIVRQR